VSVKKNLREFYAMPTPPVWVLIALVLLSAEIILSHPSAKPEGMAFWTFSRNHTKVAAHIAVREQSARAVFVRPNTPVVSNP
jgi:hypothetical protein